MPEPRIAPDWDDLNFRRPVSSPSRPGEGSRLFVTGVAIFIGVALVYPWYSFMVHAKMTAWMLEAGARELTAQVQAEVRESAEELQAQQVIRAESNQRERLRRVSLAGTSTVQGQRLVIVSLGSANLSEATPTVCRLAERRFKVSLSGERLRVQVLQGSRPAYEAGGIVCP